MKKNYNVIFAFILLLLFSSCATYKVKYAKDQKDWKKNNIPPVEQPEYSVYLIGDAGHSDRNDVPSKALKVLKKHLELAEENSHVVFMGDNIYPYGLPPADADTALIERALYRLNAQIDILDNYKGNIIFIPGNHDWKKHGAAGIRRQEAYVEEKLNRGKENKKDWENYFLPDNACSGPEVVKVNDKLVLVVIDSEWYLWDWDKDPTINDGCEAKSREVFEFHFEEALRKNKDKNVIVLLHHPLYSYGPHGGGFSLKQHIFPLTDMNEKLYVPLPGLGTVAAILRSTVGLREDLAGGQYRKMKKGLLDAAERHGTYIFAAGHEHTQQHIEIKDNEFIQSGSGSKRDPVKLGKGADFVHGAQGFSKIDFYEDGTAWVEYWTAIDNEGNGELIFRKKIREPLPDVIEEPPTSFKEYEKKKQL